MKKWIVMLSMAMFGAGAMAQTPATPATPAAASTDKAAPAKADSSKAKAKKTSTKKKSHAPAAKDPMKNKGA
ncbi:hypothetical protein [Cupriavidus sp. CP313]